MFRMITTGFLMALLFGCTAMDHSVSRIDGFPAATVWESIPVRSLEPPREWVDAGRNVQEKGTCRFMIENGMLYVTAKFDDAIIAAAGEKDGDDLYHGDCCEVFIKPLGRPYYWEIWISPAALRSVATWRKRGELESQGRLLAGREIQLSVETVERSGWRLEAALPLPQVPGLEPGAWEVLIARQDYDASHSKETRELSSFPQLSKPSFHLTEEYFRMK